MAINVFDSGVVYEKFFRRKTYWNPRIITNQTFKPLANYFGKYIGAMLLVMTVFLTTFIYFFAVYDLKTNSIPLDWGSTFISYIGLILVSSVFVAIGLLSSLITKNQVDCLHTRTHTLFYSVFFMERYCRFNV